MSKGPKAEPIISGLFRYGLSVVSVAVSFGITVLLEGYTFRTPLFFPAIILSTWIGGTGPGLLAVLLSALSINFYFLEPRYSFSFGLHDLPHLAVFLTSAVLVSSWSAARKRTENALRRARNELEEKVAERTADLSRSNEQLRTEIADRKRAEEALREQASLLDLTHDTIFVRDMNNVITYWNRGAEEMYGYKREEVLGRVTHELLRTIFPAPLEEISSELHQTGRWSGELIHTKRDGTTAIVASRWSVQRDDQGRPIALLETNNDITERKHAEEAVVRQANLLEQTHDAIVVWEFPGRINYWNRGAEELYGFSKAEAIGRLSHELLHTVHSIPVPLFEAALDRDGEWTGELTHTTRDGRQIIVESRHVLVRQAEGRRLVLETNRDITERKQAETLLAGEKTLLEMVARGDSLPLILDALCRLVEELASGALSSILLLNSKGDRLEHGAAPSLPKAYTDAVDGLAIGAAAGSCGTAAYRARPVIVSDIATDPLWAKYRDAALPHGLRACWSTPIFSSGGKVMGTFAIYYHEPRVPTPAQHDLIEQVTHLASIALERKRAEAALRASEQVARGQVEALAQSLDILATAPGPENLIAQMLSTIGRFLSAQSVVLWLLNESDQTLVMRAAAEGENFAPVDSEHPFIKDPQAWKQSQWIQEIFFTGVPVVVEDVGNDPRISTALLDYFKAKGSTKFLTIPTLVGGDVKGFIGIRHADRPSYRPEEIELAQALAHQAMFAVQFNQFAEQGQKAAVFEERNRMARDVHDTLAQGFTGVIVQLEAAEDALSLGERKDADKHMRRAANLARESLSEARRSVHALRPHALERANLWDALKGIIKTTTAGTALHTTFKLRGKLPTLPSIWQENLLHIGQEALTNTLKYARANNFETRLSCNPHGLRLELRDDGAGFAVQDRHGGMGLTGMRERVEQMSGELEIVSARGKGTDIVVAVPLDQELMS
jgi:PAS domain S-box-containing protein